MRRLAVIGAVVLAVGGMASPAGALAPAHALIQGTGSSWSANAVNQWVADVSSQGLQVVYTGSGSAQGRTDFANGITDYAVSDIGYQGHDAITGALDTNCIPGQKCRDFAYEPVVAGGTSFPYQIKVAGKLVRNLRLSGQTITDIFTRKITNWADPAITADNNGRKLPSLKIIPVVHSEGSGSTAQLTTYMNTMFPTIWQPFIGKKGFTEYFPCPKSGQGICQNGSDGVMNFISSAAANGAIGYDEYSYPLAKNWPVAKVLNQAGNFVLPDQYNVAVALTHAVINTDKNSSDYLLQKLDNVYVAPEKQAYPLSSYSYVLVPTAADDVRLSTAKRQTLADFLYFSVCQGQKEMGPIGYSPLPINLVQASFAQTAKLKAADPKVDLTQRDVTTCQNPTFVAGHPEVNHLAQIAPLPPACDHRGAGPANNDGTCPRVGIAVNGNGGNGNGNGAGGNGGSGPSGSAPSAGHTSGGVAGQSTAANAGPSGATSIDPDTGEIVTIGGDGDAGTAAPVPVDVASRPHNLTNVLAPLAVIELLAVLIIPPLAYFFFARRRARRP